VKVLLLQQHGDPCFDGFSDGMLSFNCGFCLSDMINSHFEVPAAAVEVLT
jgi:uncharacterized membrane protein